MCYVGRNAQCLHMWLKVSGLGLGIYHYAFYFHSTFIWDPCNDYVKRRHCEKGEILSVTWTDVTYLDYNVIFNNLNTMT